MTKLYTYIDSKPLIDLEEDSMIHSPKLSRSSEPMSASTPTSATAQSEQGLDDQQLEQEEKIAYEEDKNRKVLRLLDYGDMVLDVYNVSQIAGLDARGKNISNYIYLPPPFFSPTCFLT